MTCWTCGRDDEHADWCANLKRMMRDRDAGGKPTGEWPAWLTATPTQASGNWGKDPIYCPNGHELTPEVLYVYPATRQKRCRICYNAYQRAYYRRRRS